MEKKKVEHQKGNLTITESQEQHVQSIVLSNSGTFDPSGASNIMLSSGVSAKEVYDAIFGLLGIRKDISYTIGGLIKHLRERNINITWVGKIKMPPGDIDFSIRDQFTSGFRQRFLENVLFEDAAEKQNFEDILKMIDDTVTLHDITIHPTVNPGAHLSLFLYGSVGDSPESIRVLGLEIPY
jgi:hypothetical protein